MYASSTLTNLAAIVEIKPLTPDDMSDVRYVHSAAFRVQAKAHLSQSEIQAFTDHVYSLGYGDKLAAENLHLAWLGDELIGTCGWSPVSDNGATARIRSIFVRPLFTRLGIGRCLVERAEAEARRAGFTQFTLRASVNSVGFFQTLGFEIKSYGVRNIDAEQGLPVRFMRKAAEPGAAAATSKSSSKTNKSDTAAPSVITAPPPSAA